MFLLGGGMGFLWSHVLVKTSVSYFLLVYFPSCLLVFIGFRYLALGGTAKGDDDKSLLGKIYDKLYEVSIPVIRRLDKFHDWVNRDDSKK